VVNVTIRNCCRAVSGSGGSVVENRIGGTEERLLLKAKPTWYNDPLVKAYVDQKFFNTSAANGVVAFTLTHPEDVTPGLTADDIECKWITDFERYQRYVESTLNPVGNVLRASAYHKEFKFLPKAQQSGLTIFDLGFLYRLSAGEINTAVPSELLNGSIVVRTIATLGGTGVGSNFTITFNSNAPMEWGFDFQTSRDATWRTLPVAITASGSRTANGAWSNNEDFAPGLNMSIRPYWLFDPTIKGSIGTYFVPGT
jgi:hypothetical protein